MLAKDVKVHGEKIEKLAEVVTTQAVHNQRMNDMDRKIEELRHGQGFVQRDLDGLWGIGGKARGG